MNPSIPSIPAALAAFAVTSATFLAGCGGGGGETAKASTPSTVAQNTSSPSPSLTPTSLLLGSDTNAASLGKTGITSQNAAKVADLSVGLSQLSRYIETDYTGSVAVERANAALVNASAPSVDTMTQYTTRTCKDGGKAVIQRSSLTGAPESTPKPGDRALIALEDCKIASTDIGTLQLKGTVDEFLTEYEGNLAGGGSGHAGMGVLLKDLMIGAEFYPSLNRSFMVVVGEMGLSVDATEKDLAVASSASRLNVTLTEGVSQYGMTLLDYKSSIKQDYVSKTFSLVQSFRVNVNSSSDASIAGSYTVTTTKPFTGTARGGAFWAPGSGEMTIVASNGSKLTLTAINGVGAGQVKLSIDENADGNVRDQYVTWDELVD